MKSKGNKVILYEDDEGERQYSVLPEDAPLEEAPLGIPAQGLNILLPPEYEPFRPQLERVLAERGILSKGDFKRADIASQLKRALAQVQRYDAYAIRDLNLKE